MHIWQVLKILPTSPTTNWNASFKLINESTDGQSLGSLKQSTGAQKATDLYVVHINREACLGLLWELRNDKIFP